MIIFLWLVGNQIRRPLMYDDANFAFAAKAVAETGVPWGNQGWMSDRGDFSQREQWALWHPPLYVYLIGTLARLPWPQLLTLRAPGIVGGLATGLLTFLLAADVSAGTPSERQLSGGIAATVALLSPLSVQSALILDIDFPLLLPGMLLFSLLYLRLEDTDCWPLLAPLFALLLWAKMTNPLLLVPALVGWQVLRGKPARGLGHGLAIGVGGAALFAISWLGVGTALHFPLDMPFAVNLAQWRDSADVARRAYADAGSFIAGTQPAVLWLGPGLVALGLMGVCVRLAQLARHWRIRKVDLFVILLAPLVVGYVNKSAGWFPKYQVALAPVLAIIGAPLAARVWPWRRAWLAAVLLATTAGVGVLVMTTIGDDWAVERSWAIDPTAAAWLVAILLLPLVAGLACRERALTPLAIAALAVGWSLGTDQYQRQADYATGYWYGTTGTDAATRWVDARIRPSQTYVAAKEVAWRARSQRYVDQDTLTTLLESGQPFSDAWQGEPIVAIVAWSREPYVADLLNRKLLGFHETARLGDYVVYEPEVSGR